MLKQLICRPYKKGNEYHVDITFEDDQGRTQTTDVIIGHRALRFNTEIPGQSIDMMVIRQKTTQELIFTVRFIFGDGKQRVIDHPFDGGPYTFEFKPPATGVN